jgi:hypothetical protein
VKHWLKFLTGRLNTRTQRCTACSSLSDSDHFPRLCVAMASDEDDRSCQPCASDADKESSEESQSQSSFDESRDRCTGCGQSRVQGPCILLFVTGLCFWCRIKRPGIHAVPDHRFTGEKQRIEEFRDIRRAWRRRRRQHRAQKRAAMRETCRRIEAEHINTDDEPEYAPVELPPSPSKTKMKRQQHFDRNQTDIRREARKRKRQLASRARLRAGATQENRCEITVECQNEFIEICSEQNNGCGLKMCSLHCHSTHGGDPAPHPRIPIVCILCYLDRAGRTTSGPVVSPPLILQGMEHLFNLPAFACVDFDLMRDRGSVPVETHASRVIEDTILDCDTPVPREPISDAIQPNRSYIHVGLDVVLIFAQHGVFCNMYGLPANVATNVLEYIGQTHHDTHAFMIHTYPANREDSSSELILQIAWEVRFPTRGHQYVVRRQWSPNPDPETVETLVRQM